jgi:hypothetical protein
MPNGNSGGWNAAEEVDDRLARELGIPPGNYVRDGNQYFREEDYNANRDNLDAISHLAVDGVHLKSTKARLVKEDAWNNPAGEGTAMHPTGSTGSRGFNAARSAGVNVNAPYPPYSSVGDALLNGGMSFHGGTLYDTDLKPVGRYGAQTPTPPTVPTGPLAALTPANIKPKVPKTPAPAPAQDTIGATKQPPVIGPLGTPPSPAYGTPRIP